MSKRTKKTDSKPADIELSTPWIDGQHRYSYSSNALSRADNDETARAFIAERSQVHKEFIRESEKTKRLGYGLSAGLLGAAVVVPVVAPEGREAISFMTSGGLVLFAAGAFGYSKLKLSALKQKVIAEKK